MLLVHVIDHNFDNYIMPVSGLALIHCELVGTHQI